jgi:phosphomannomutase
MLEILSAGVSPSPSGGGVRGGGISFSELLRPLREKFYISEEINFEFQNPNILEEVKAKYADAQIDNIDGYDFNYPNWRFNLRSSNTQNLIRINLEADSAELLKQKTDEVCGFINSIK